MNNTCLLDFINLERSLSSKIELRWKKEGVNGVRVEIKVLRDMEFV